MEEHKDRSNQKVNTVYQTRNYDQFKVLDGNRGVSDGRVTKIKKSIREVGYIPSPIIVNENYEVIDGQGRLQACRELNEPVAFVRIPGIGIKECISMNINQTNWRLVDYIQSYSDRGEVSYRYLMNLLHKYPKIRTLTVLHAVSLKGDERGTSSTDPIKQRIMNGSFTCNEEEYQAAITRLDLAEQFHPLFEGMRGGENAKLIAIIDCSELEGVDMDRLYKQVSAFTNQINGLTTERQVIATLEQIYNYRLPSNRRVYLTAEYDRWLRTRK